MQLGEQVVELGEQVVELGEQVVELGEQVVELGEFCIKVPHTVLALYLAIPHAYHTIERTIYC